MITKIVSGDQTGADRAALDFAIQHNIPHGGWIPKGRLTEEGPLPYQYQLWEMKSRSYVKRTEQNVIDSDGTLIISHGKLAGGSEFTRQFAKKHNRPWMHIDLNNAAMPESAELINKWIEGNKIKTLNVAGPRASKDAAIYKGVMNLLEKTFSKNEIINVVLFDFGGVLSEEGWKKGLRVIAEANCLDVDSFVQTAADTIYETGYILGKGSENDFWNSMRRKTGIKGDDASLTHELLSRFILNNSMIDIAKKLKSKKVIVGILSDQTNWLDILNSRIGFFKYFDHVFNSYHMGKGKRDATLFDDIAELLKADPNRILFIDDDPGNIERARQKGWNAILYVNQDSFLREIRKLLGMKL
ncbi:MAG: HAD-IA family hydrolase [Smithellaceae bacterium]